MKRNKTIWKLLALSAWLFCVLIVPYQGLAGMPGFDDKEIRIGNLSPQTGVAAAWGASGRSPDILFKMINDKGGIHGRKIKYYVRDDQYNPALAKTAVKELVERIGILAVTSITSGASGNAVKSYLAENDVLICAPTTGAMSPVIESNKKAGDKINRYVFSYIPLFEDESSILTDFIIKKLKLKKLGILYQNDMFGINGLAGVKQRLAHYGMDLYEAIPIETADKDFGSQMMRLKSSGVDAAILWLNANSSILALKTAKAINYNPRFFSFYGNTDYPLLMKLSNGLWEGVINSTFLPDPFSNDPAVKAYREAAKKYAPEEQWGFTLISGIAATEPLVEGLKRAGRNLSPEALIKALESLNNWKGIGAPVTWSASMHQGTDSIQVTQCGPSGKVILLQGWKNNELATWKNK